MAKRHKTTTETTPLSNALSTYADVEALRDEIEEWRDNLEGGGLEHTAKYDQVSEAADTLDNVATALQAACDALVEALPSGVAEGDVTYRVLSPYGRRAMPRWMRASNAEAAVRAGLDAASAWLEAQDSEDPTLSSQEVDRREEVENQINEARDALDELEAVEFPSMF